MHVSNDACQHLRDEPKLAREVRDLACILQIFCDIDRCPLHFRTELLYDSLSFNPWCCERCVGKGMPALPHGWSHSASGSSDAAFSRRQPVSAASSFLRETHA